MTTCCVKFCGNNTKSFFLKSNGIAFYKFPKEPRLREKWVEASGRPNWTPTHFSAVCARHFAEDCYSKKCRRILLDTAIPTLYLPSNTDSVVEREEENKQIPNQDDALQEPIQVIQENNEPILRNTFEYVLVTIPDQNTIINQDQFLNMNTADISKEVPNLGSLPVVIQTQDNELEQSTQQSPEPPLDQSAEQISGPFLEQPLQQSTEQSSGQYSEQSSGQYSEQSSGQYSEQYSEQPSEECSAQPPNQTVEQPSNIDAVPAPSYIPNLVPQYVPNQLPQYVPNQIIQFIPNQVPQYITNQMPEYITTQVPEFIANQVPEYVTNGIPEYITNQVPKFITNPMPQFIINQVPEYVINPVPDYVTNQAPEYISPQVPQHVPSQVLDQSAQAAAPLDQRHDAMNVAIEDTPEEPTVSDGDTAPSQFEFAKPNGKVICNEPWKLRVRIESLEKIVFNKKKTVKRLRNQVSYLKHKVNSLDATIKKYQEKEYMKMKQRMERKKAKEDAMQSQAENNKDCTDKENNHSNKEITIEIEYISDQLEDGVAVNADQIDELFKNINNANIQT